MAIDPPLYTEEELRVFNAKSRELFIESRMAEDPEGFRVHFRRNRALAEGFFLKTDSLRSIDASLLSESEDMQDVSRYLCGPPISQDDLSTLINRPPNKKTLNDEQAVRALDVFKIAFNKELCPWLSEDRKPTKEERSAAIASAATLKTVEQFRTERRNQASGEQEAEVQTNLEEAGLVKIEVKGSRLMDPAELPPGSFARETYIANKKCDIPVRLWDGSLLVLECKVSNSERNGWKRLKAEVVSKKFEWTEWGARFDVRTITGAVVSGMFDLSCLTYSHHVMGVALFWQHELGRLQEFVKAGKRN